MTGETEQKSRFSACFILGGCQSPSQKITGMPVNPRKGDACRSHTEPPATPDNLMHGNWHRHGNGDFQTVIGQPRAWGNQNPEPTWVYRLRDRRRSCFSLSGGSRLVAPPISIFSEHSTPSSFLWVAFFSTLTKLVPPNKYTVRLYIHISSDISRSSERHLRIAAQGLFLIGQSTPPHPAESHKTTSPGRPPLAATEVI